EAGQVGGDGPPGAGDDGARSGGRAGVRDAGDDRGEAMITVGKKIEPLVKTPIERIQLVRYAGASGDFNPIHVDEEFARKAGYKSVFAHGMLSMGFLGQLLSDTFGPTAVRKLAVRFKAITWVGDVVTLHGEVV